MARRFRPRPRWVIAPSLASALLAGAIALLQVDKLPSWLAWCSPWLAAVAAAVLGALVVVVDRWHARRRAEADRELQAVERLHGYLGRQEVLPRVGDARASALALRVHPAIEVPPAPTNQSNPAAGGRTAWRSLFPALGLRKGRTGLDPDLPLFVTRDDEPAIREWLRDARTGGGFLILVGDSCVGKTRLLYEAACTDLSDFAVLAPDLGDGALVNAIAQATFPLPNLIVWLDELQRFLPGPYLTDGSTPITAAAVRQLLDAPTPVIILATLWPAYASTLRAHDPDSTGSPRYPEAMDILTDRRINETRLNAFSDTERTIAARLAARDPRLATAVADRDYNVTEALAGCRELVGRYQRATAAQLAILHAAIDARRVGIQAPLTEQLLCAVARGYLNTVLSDDTWFAPAMRELASHGRPQDKTSAPLIPIASPDRRTVLGHTVTDYLLQRLTRQRRTEPLPTLTWQALTEHTHNTEDLTRLAQHAANRMLYTHAISIYQRLANLGDTAATYRLADLKAEQGSAEEAIEILRPLAEADDRSAALRMAELLIGLGRTDEVRARAGAGDVGAAYWLVKLLTEQGSAEGAIEILRPLADAHDLWATTQLFDLLAKQGRAKEVTQTRRRLADEGSHTATILLVIDHLATLLMEGYAEEAIDILRRGADADSFAATVLLADLLMGLGRTDELRARADAGDVAAAYRLADLEAEQGRADEAIETLRPFADAHDLWATKCLSDLLAGEGRTDELRARADAGDVAAAYRLVKLLAEQGRTDELRAEMHAGTHGAAERLIDLLAEQDKGTGRAHAPS